MSISNSQNTNPSSSGTLEKRFFKNLIIIITLTICLVAIFTVVVCYSLVDFLPSSSVILTFWISFLIGLGGAGVYLALLLIVEKNLDILKNDVMKDQRVMSFFFLLSGGFVAAITQVSTGVLVAGGTQAVFMVGFGWLGALAGVAFTKQQAKLSIEKSELSAVKEARERTIEGTDDQLIAAREAWAQEKQDLLAAVANLRKQLKDREASTKGGR